MTDSTGTSEQERLPLDEPLADGGPDGGAQDPGRGAQETAAPGAEPAAPVETPEEQAARIRELTADLQRLQAEYVNYKRRVDRDRELVLQNAKFSILSALLPVLDDVDRAREHEELTGGFKAIAESIERIVAGQGLVRFGAPGDPFDPRTHEALMHSLSPEATMTTCDKVVQAGYQFGDRVVRPALVTVVDPDPSRSAGTGADADASTDAGTGADTEAPTDAGTDAGTGAGTDAALGADTGAAATG